MLQAAIVKLDSMSLPVSFTRTRAGTVLVVDDYEEARAAIREHLESNGHHVMEARNGKEALDLLVSTPTPDIAMIVLDLQMPIMDGWQFLRILGTYVRLAAIPVLVVSGYAERLDRAAHGNVVGCLQPPYELDSLLAMVNARTSPPSPTGSA